MAQQFLKQLPKVRSGELPDGAECMICKEEYGTVPSANGIIEHAVFLPCLHHVGSECIAIWLSPESRVGNSCPMCRKIFFEAELVYDEDDDEDEDYGYEGEYSNEDDEENDEENGAYNDDEDVEDGDTSEEAGDRVDGREQTELTISAGLQNARRSFLRYNYTGGWHRLLGFERWSLPTDSQIEDCLKRARQALLRPPPSGLLYRSLALTYSPPADLESKAVELAIAYLNMALRETVLYHNLLKAGARMPSLEILHKSLDACQEQALLWELGQRGAFKGLQFMPGQISLTNRESWDVHRSKGEVYTYEYCLQAVGVNGLRVSVSLIEEPAQEMPLGMVCDTTVLDLTYLWY